MCCNNNVTSAKKDFSSVIDDRILPKETLSCCCLQHIATYAHEWLLTISYSNAHTIVGESISMID